MDGSGTDTALPTSKSLTVTQLAEVDSESDVIEVLLVETKPMKFVDELVVTEEAAAPALRFALIVPLTSEPLIFVRKKYPPIAVGLPANKEKLIEFEALLVDSQTFPPPGDGL